jgi:protein O-mannosyl-transferase
MARPRNSARRTAPLKSTSTPARVSPAVFAAISAGVLAIAVGVVYGRAINSPFVFDDSISIVENSSIRHLWPLIGDDVHRGPLNPARDLPTSGRPLVNLSFAVNYKFGQLDPWGYHAFNLMLHLLSACLLAAIVRRTLLLPHFGGRFDRVAAPLGVAAALVWAVHPLATEAVVYVTQRTELMAGFFYLATLYASLRYWTAGTNRLRAVWLLAAVLACACGMAGKEIMVTAPVAVLLFQWTFLATSFRDVRRSWPLYLALASTWAVLLYLNYDAPRSQSAGFHLEVPFYSWWFTQAKVLWIYLKLAIWPAPLSIHYQFEYLDSIAAAWPWLLATIGLILATVFLLFKRTPTGFVLATTMLILAPTSLIPIVTEVAAERRMYLSLAALAALAICGLYYCVDWLCGYLSRRSDNMSRFLHPLLAVLLVTVAFGLVSINRLAVYKNEADLWRDALASFPNDFVALNGLGRALLEQGDCPGAVNELQMAVQLAPNFPDAQSNLGHALFRAGHPQEAVAHLQTALSLRPTHANAHINLGSVFSALDRPNDAIAEFNAALALQEDFAVAHYDLANALVKVGKQSEAIEHYRRAIELDPADINPRQNLAGVLNDLERVDEAMDCLRDILRIYPDDPNTHFNLGVALAAKNHLPEAIEQFKEVVRLQSTNLNARWQLTLAWAAAQNRTQAIESAQKLIELARAAGQTKTADQIQRWLDQYRGTGGAGN